MSNYPNWEPLVEAMRDFRIKRAEEAEKDRDGVPQHSPGAKLDAGKNRLGLVLGGFSRALEEVGKVGTFGAAKYMDNGWRQVKDGQERYTDALLRHLIKTMQGEDVDSDSGLLHLAHMAWNALAILELNLEER